MLPKGVFELISVHFTHSITDGIALHFMWTVSKSLLFIDIDMNIILTSEDTDLLCYNNVFELSSFCGKYWYAV